MATTAATPRTRDRVAGGSCPTTSSSPDCAGRSLRYGLMLFVLQQSARARRQTEDANEPRCILLVITVAHGERRQIGAIERLFGLAAGDGNVALIEREPDRAGDLL